MIICDRCKQTVVPEERVCMSTKDDPYGEQSDYCKTCFDGLHAGLGEIKRQSKEALNNKIRAHVAQWNAS